MKTKTPYDAAFELVCNNVNKGNLYFAIDYKINSYRDKIFDKYYFICECDAKNLEKIICMGIKIIKLDSDLIKAQVAKFIEEHTKVVL